MIKNKYNLDKNKLIHTINTYTIIPLINTIIIYNKKESIYLHIKSTNNMNK